MCQTLINVVALPDLHFYWCLRPVSFIVIIVWGISLITSVKSEGVQLVGIMVQLNHPHLEKLLTPDS